MVSLGESIDKRDTVHHIALAEAFVGFDLIQFEGSNQGGETMEPFNLTAGQVLDPTSLGYDYVLASTPIPVTA